MSVVIFGATGMVGQGVLLECLRDPDVEKIVVVGRQTAGVKNSKLTEIVRRDLFDLAPLKDDLKNLDACFFCIGVSEVGMSEADYRHITFDLTMAVAKALLAVSPALTFKYISGQGTGGGAMWARVKGETENALLPNALQGRIHVQARSDRCSHC